MAPKPFRLQRQVHDVTQANRDLIERTLFAGLCRVFCKEHARYAVDRYTLETSRRMTVAHVTTCCALEDDSTQIPFLIDATPSTAKRHAEKILEMTGVAPGSGYDLQAWVTMGLWRRRRRDRMTLEATLQLLGEDRFTGEQRTRLRALIVDATAAKKLVFRVHGSAILKAWIRDDGTKTIVDLEMCCPLAERAMFEVHDLV